MRERIKIELSDKFSSMVLLPEITNDYRVAFKEMILLNKAYAIMLARVKIIDIESAKKILEGLSFVEKNLKPDDLNGKLEDFYFNVENALLNRIGKVGGKLHAGRSRNDIHATIGRMSIRKTVWKVFDDVVALQELLLKKVEENKDSVMTGYTHFQPGQPITLAHYYLAIYSALVRDFSRIKSAYENLNMSPLGVAAFAGSSFPVDRQLLCDLLGFDKIMENSLDCIASKDYILQLLAAYSIMAVNISRMAEDMYFWSTYENGILDPGGEISICSSIMPQKKNPVSLEYAKSKAAHTIASLNSSLIVLKGISYSNTMDIFEASTMYWEGLEQLRQAICSISETVAYSKLRREIAARKAAENLCTVTSLVDYMVKHCEISFTEAHHIVGRMIAIITEDGTMIKGITPELIKRESEAVLGYKIKISADQINGVLDPFNNVESKQGIGGPSTKSVTKMLENAKDSLNEEKIWFKNAKAHVQEAYMNLEIEQAKICK